MEALRLSADAFDAEGYDPSFTTTALGRCLRGLVWERLDAAFVAGMRVLEIGCGTGEDAVHLACHGIDVLATDPSLPMLHVAREKAERAGCAQRVRFLAAGMERLGSELAGERFDGIYSSFGAVNCVAELDRGVAESARLLAPGAPLVWVVLGRHVPWEWAWFLARAEGRKAFRRLAKDGVAWRGIRIRYPTPAELARTLSAHFSNVRRRCLGFVLPPSYASRWLDEAPRSLAVLTCLERAAQRWQSLAALSDHYIIEARRVSEDGDDRSRGASLRSKSIDPVVRDGS